jgi:hypothetical protein
MTLERKLFILRIALWLVACVVIGGPLEIARKTIGDLAYTGASILTLLIFHFVGLAVSKIILSRAAEKLKA